jgi:hypothetical protein
MQNMVPMIQLLANSPNKLMFCENHADGAVIAVLYVTD